jgi:DNA primase
MEEIKMIEKERIEELKRSIDLVALVESKGISLKKNGKSYKGLCPFHEDTNPSLSVNPSTNLWQCFGCSAGGDVISFIEQYDHVDFKGAIAQLSAFSVQRLAKAKNPEPGTLNPEPMPVKERKLLNKVMSFYQHTFTQDTRGLRYLKDDRGITDNQSFKDFGAGYVNGDLLQTLPEDEETIKALKRIGTLNPKGHEIFYNCVVFPLYDSKGSIVNLYGRHVDQDNDPPSLKSYGGTGVSHLYLPGPRTGLVKPAYSAVKRSQTIILTESIIDALTLYDQGFKNVVPVYGVNGLIDDHLSLFDRRVKEVYL